MIELPLVSNLKDFRNAQRVATMNTDNPSRIRNSSIRILAPRDLKADFARTHRVRQRETDASGLVYFANYICMMEETEYAFLRSRGLSVVTHDSRGIIGFPRVSTEIQIESPACFDDELEIRLQVAGIDGVKIEYRFHILCGTEPIATGYFAVACCRFPLGEPPRAILIPDFILERFGASSSG